MRISYRITSGAALGVLALHLAARHLLPPPDLTTVSSAGAPGWDPCSVWEQMPALMQVLALVFLVSFVVLTVQGLRNHAVPRWLAIAGLAGLVPIVDHKLWLIHCSNKVSVVTFFIWLLAFALVCLHQILQRPARITA